jgi:hypothetical protein
MSTKDLLYIKDTNRLNTKGGKKIVQAKNHKRAKVDVKYKKFTRDRQALYTNKRFKIARRHKPL